MMVLQVVKDQYDEQDLVELRQLLIDFNHRKMQKHLEKTVTEKKYSAINFVLLMLILSFQKTNILISLKRYRFHRLIGSKQQHSKQNLKA
jgi:hypothetical protein